MGGFKPRIKETRWDFSRMEPELIRVWEEEGMYRSVMDPGDPREVVAVDTPPPYASGRWHIGGASHYAQLDMMARYFRLKGFNVIAPFYADRNGLPVEVQVERTYNVVAHEMAKTRRGREEFLRLCREFLDRAEKEIVEIWRRIGCSFDYWVEGTDSPKYRAMTQATFIELYKRGLIYEAERPVRWCPRCRTTLAEAEIEYKEEEGELYYIVYKVKGSGRELVVATTRPELIASCSALAYNPRDERYAGLAGGNAIAPIYGHEMVIVEHPAAKPQYGTGLMMICSYGDEEDVRLFQELGLKPKVIIREDGTLSEEAGPLSGLKVEEARRAVADILRKEGLLVRVERIKHEVPACWRCKTPLQIIHRKELFLTQLPYKDKIKEIADRLEFKPEFHKKKLFDWIDSLTMDWPISRDRFYGTEIPMWECRACGAKLVPEPGRYYRPWAEDPPWDKCPKCGAPKGELVGDSRVFDTWFDSSITPLYVTRWMDNKRFHEKAIANVFRQNGQDIIRTWLYYTLLRVYQLTGRPAFRWVRITGLGLDPQGRPMHKSLGNVIDPEPVVEEFGADAFRFWTAVSSKLGYDYRYDRGKLRTGRNFATKLWNIARFISSFPEPEGARPEVYTDRAFLALYEGIISRVDKAYLELEVYEPASMLYELAWDYFASNYVELVKDRAYNREGRYSREEQESAWATLHAILKGILIALSPIMPFITDAIYRRLYGESVHRQLFPEATIPGPERENLEAAAREIIRANKAIWSYKKSSGLRLSEPIRGYVIAVPEELKGFAKDLESLHKTRVVAFREAPRDSIKLGESVYLVKE